MRTALVLLFLLAAAAAVGSLLPQIPNSPERVASYRLAHRFFGTLFLRAGFFDVYGSWWFVLILTLLFVSLIACLLPRSRAMIRTIRQRPIQAREIDAFRRTGITAIALPSRRTDAPSRRRRARSGRSAASCSIGRSWCCWSP
jgi:cytochrome c biogenesis protein